MTGCLSWGIELRMKSCIPRWGYGLRSLRSFLVGDGFPMIVPSDLRTGVAGVRYSISINSCSPYEMEVDEASSLLRDLI